MIQMTLKIHASINRKLLCCTSIEKQWWSFRPRHNILHTLPIKKVNLFAFKNFSKIEQSLGLNGKMHILFVSQPWLCGSKAELQDLAGSISGCRNGRSFMGRTTPSSFFFLFFPLHLTFWLLLVCLLCCQPLKALWFLSHPHRSLQALFPTPIFFIIVLTFSSPVKAHLLKM